MKSNPESKGIGKSEGAAIGSSSRHARHYDVRLNMRAMPSTHGGVPLLGGVMLVLAFMLRINVE